MPYSFRKSKSAVVISSFFVTGRNVCPWLVTYAPACNHMPRSVTIYSGLRMASPTQTCSPLRLSSLPTAIGRPGYSADDIFIPRTPDLSRAKISASFLLWFAYGEATTPAWCNTFQLLRHFTLNEKSLTRRTNEAMRWHRRLRTTQSCGFSDK